MKTKLQVQILFALFFAQSCLGQSWIETWQQSTNFYTVQNAFNAHCVQEANNQEDKDEIEPEDEGLFPGYIQFKRWESFIGPRVYPSGDLSQLSDTWKNYESFLNQNTSAARQSNPNQTASTTWTALGPFGPLTGNATNGLPRKAGRINFITYDPSNANTFWIGAASGGLWKTINNGFSWTTNTDNLAVIGCTDLAIDPTNSSIMYLATGDGYASFINPSSIGVLKSTDGGITWAATGLVFPVSQKVEMRRIIVNPLNHLIVLAATSIGIYRSTTGGVGAWTQTIGTNTFDLEFKPTNPDTVYASGIRFRRSVDGGATWVQISAGIPTSGSNRMETATTVANPNLVYVVSSSSTTNGLQGVYRSTDAGTTFTLMANSPNIIGEDCFITSTGGQGSYDLAFDASPLNQSEIVVGGLGAWRSLDGGTTWTNIGCAYNWSSSVPYVHTDHHEFEYTTAGILYGVNDGGVYEYTGTVWNDITNPMNIAQIYKIGCSSLSPNLFITGHQDNGSNIYNNGIYSASLAADGTDNFIDRTNDLNMFASIYSGQFYKSTNAGGSWNSCVTGLTGSGAFVTPWKQDPQVATTLYCGRDQMYRSTNSATNWSATPGALVGVNVAQFVTEFAIAPSNNQFIYVIHGTTGVYTTSNAGTTWTLNNSGLPVASASASFITVDPTNPLVAWVTFSGYSSGNKIFKTINGGTTWTNYSANLPNLPANCSVFETGNANQRIYVGMDVGVYYRDNLSATWTLYNTGLPNTPVMDMEISPAAPTKIKAATFGRGVYEVDIVPAALPPVSSFSFIGGNTCSVPDVLTMSDLSTNSPTSWSWSVNPSAGVTINTPTSQNPTITITLFGSYTISLTASNGFGPGNVTTQTITLTAPPVNATTSTYSVCSGQPVTLTATGANSYNWQPVNLFGPTVTFTPVVSQTYTVTGTNSIGCTATDTVSVSVVICTGIIPSVNGGFSFNVYPNPTTDYLNINISVSTGTDFKFDVRDISGKLLIQQTNRLDASKSEVQLDISSLASGIYFLTITSKDGNSQPIKILKEK